MIPGACQTLAKRTLHALLVVKMILAAVQTHQWTVWRNSAIKPLILAPQTLVFKTLPVYALLETSALLASALLGIMDLPVKQLSACVTQTLVSMEAPAKMAWLGPPAFVAQDTQAHSVKWILMNAFPNHATMEQYAGMGLVNTPATASQATKASTVTWK